MEIYLIPAWTSNWLSGHGWCDPRQRMHLGYFVSNALVVLLLPMLGQVPHFCLMQALTGLPCPGCGVTHALRLALSLRFHESVMANPAGLAIAATIVWQLLARPLAMWDERASPLRNSRLAVAGANIGHRVVDGMALNTG